MQDKPKFSIAKDNRLSEFLGKEFSWWSVLAAIILIGLVYLFFSGWMNRFYASALFSFYALTQHMWVSVIMLGVFQTLIMIPLRIFRVKSSNNVEAFQEAVEAASSSGALENRLKKDFKLGNKTFLFYLVDFMIQLLSFMSIGRLFLTDFYSKPINTNFLYSFVPFPDYPIQSTFFKLPYFTVSSTHQFGWKAVLLGWFILLGIQLIVWMVKNYQDSKKEIKEKSYSMPLAGKYGLGYIILSLIFAIFIMTRFPTGLALKIFVGDVSIPNQTLNTITAVVTFALLLWFGYRKIEQQTKLAISSGIDQRIIFKTRQKMFKETFQVATFVGLGAYFITNHIPSAFELSIFTFELIALFSPFTLDKLILRVFAPTPAVAEVSGNITQKT